MNRLIRNQIDFSLVGFQIINDSVNDCIGNKHYHKHRIDLKFLAYRNRQHYHKRPAKRMHYQTYDIIVLIELIGCVFLPPRFLLEQRKLTLQIIVIYDMAKHH